MIPATGSGRAPRRRCGQDAGRPGAFLQKYSFGSAAAEARARGRLLGGPCRVEWRPHSGEPPRALAKAALDAGRAGRVWECCARWGTSSGRSDRDARSGAEKRPCRVEADFQAAPLLHIRRS